MKVEDMKEKKFIKESNKKMRTAKALSISFRTQMKKKIEQRKKKCNYLFIYIYD